MRRGWREDLLVFIAVVACLMAAPLARAEEEEGEEPGARLQFHGYGELHYNNPRIDTMSSGAGNELDFHRFVLGWEYEFSEELRIEAEIDYEHAAQELELEEAFLEYDLRPTLAIRAGTLLVPVGPLNEFHEPPLIYSVERPYVERYIVPTTWQENGAGFAGQSGQGRLSYRAYVIAGMDATRITSLGGLHDVSSKGSESRADDLAGVGRLELGVARGLTLSGSAYYGGADQRTPGLGKVELTILSGDLRYRWYGLDLRGVYDRVRLTGADRVSALVGETVGEVMQGWYAEAAYDLLRRDRTGSSGRSLRLFVRHEDLDTNKEVAPGFVADPAADREITTGGVAYYPIEKIALKTDLEHWKDGTGAKLNRVNAGLAFMF
ncbi:MAG TPA: hypothetical protein VFD83_00880 [Candidatus Polarisedimenticolia bacterium]|nr:hypothetical protein [Candidatus Polarisedimenticolia bacterium]